MLFYVVLSYAWRHVSPSIVDISDVWDAAVGMCVMRMEVRGPQAAV